MEIDERVAKIEVKVDEIHKAFFGNGRPGLLEDYHKIVGAVSFLKWIAGFAGLSGIAGFVIAVMEKFG